MGMGEVENAPEIPVVAFSAIVTDRADAPAGLPSFPSMVQKRPQDFSEVPWNTLPISIAACWSRRHYKDRRNNNAVYRSSHYHERQGCPG